MLGLIIIGKIACSIGISFVFKNILDQALPNEDTSLLWFDNILALSLILSIALLNFFRNIILAFISNQLTGYLRLKLFSQIQRYNFALASENAEENFIINITQDINNIEQMIV